MPLGMGVGMGAPTWGDGGGAAAAIIEDYWWEIHPSFSNGYLTPVWDNSIPIPGSHDTWSLHPVSSAQGFYSPKDDTIVSDEGYWDVHTISTANDSVKPLDV